MLKMTEKILNFKHSLTFKSMNNLALILDNQSKYKMTEKIYQQMMKLKKKILNSEHLKTLKSMNNLTLMFDNYEKHETAYLDKYLFTMTSINNLISESENQLITSITS